MPTILDYLGLPVPENIHGRSMRPLIEGRDVSWRDHAFCQRANQGRMLRTERYKYFLRPKPRAVALYDLENDPNEDQNLAADPAHAETVRQMHDQLLAVMREDGDPMLKTYSVNPLA
jgi:arylsulfatase A-like enzyme